jgi:hypothetical protein
MNTDSIKRAVRTFAQGFVATLALLAVPVLNNLVQAVAGGGQVTVDVNAWQSIGIAAVAGGTVAVISWAQNALEDKTGHAILPK